jgi:Flp pilus assembly pilin Flp
MTLIADLATFITARLDVRSERGQTMAEYAVVLAVITLVVIGAIQLLGGNISTAVDKVAGYIK